MRDLELRTRERRRHTGDVSDHAAYLRAQLRQGELGVSRLRAAALLGHAAAAQAVDCHERVAEPSRIRHAFRRGLQVIIAAEPYTRQIRERVCFLTPLGRAASLELCQVVLRLVVHDWPTFSRCYQLTDRARSDPDASFDTASDVVVAACDLLPPDPLWDDLRRGLIAWGVGEPFPLPLLERRDAPDLEDAPVALIATRIVEDAYSRGAYTIGVAPCPDDPGSVGVSYDLGADRAPDGPSEYLRLPRRHGLELITRYRWMAGLDPLAAPPQRGVIEFARWGRLDATLDLSSNESTCTLRFRVPPVPV